MKKKLSVTKDFISLKISLFSLVFYFENGSFYTTNQMEV